MRLTFRLFRRNMYIFRTFSRRTMAVKLQTAQIFEKKNLKNLNSIDFFTFRIRFGGIFV